MHVITKRRLRDFWGKHPDAENPLSEWFRTAKKANWSSLIDTRSDFPHADSAGICTVFNIGGNKYRLITKIYYPGRKVLIRFVMTHGEYSKGGYKDDCEC